MTTYSSLRLITPVFFRNSSIAGEASFLSLLENVKPARMGFVKKLSSEMREKFPDFQNNRYYLERVGEEERKLIGMAQRSTLKFFVYY